VKKKLCIIVPSHWETLMGGAEYQVQLLTERLVELDMFEIHYVTRRAPPGAVRPGYRVHALGDGRPLGGAFFVDTPKLWRLLKQLRPDIIYQRVACAYTGVAAYYARSHGCRMVWHVSSDRNVDRAPLPLSRRLLLEKIERSCIDYGARNADAVIVQTAQQAQLLQRNYGRTSATRIANFHPRPRESLVKPAQPIRVCWIANLKALKRPQVFVQLARDLAHLPHIEFTMVGLPYGAPDARARFEAEVGRLPNLRHVGSQPNEAVNKLLASAHLLVNTSEYEGFSNTFIQAWLRNVVVVSLVVNPDGVFDGETYGVCAHGSYDELVRAVTRLCGDSAVREKIAARARALAQESFSDANIDEVVRVLDPSWNPGASTLAIRSTRIA
jgi:glycosyltransferase involved in cell wall biosynthesis